MVKRGRAPDSTACSVLYGQISEKTNATCVRRKEFVAKFKNTHGLVRDELVGEKLDWWMAVTCTDQGVFRMCVHELGESRVDEACALISVILNIVIARALSVYLFGGRSHPLQESHSPLNDLCQ